MGAAVETERVEACMSLTSSGWSGTSRMFNALADGEWLKTSQLSASHWVEKGNAKFGVWDPWRWADRAGRSRTVVPKSSPLRKCRTVFADLTGFGRKELQQVCTPAGKDWAMTDPDGAEDRLAWAVSRVLYDLEPEFCFIVCKSRPSTVSWWSHTLETLWADDAHKPEEDCRVPCSNFRMWAGGSAEFEGYEKTLVPALRPNVETDTYSYQELMENKYIRTDIERATDKEPGFRILDGIRSWDLTEEEFCWWLARHFGKRSEPIADLTAGRSTLYRACARTGRAYIGVDTDLMNVAHAGRMAEELCSISD